MMITKAKSAAMSANKICDHAKDKGQGAAGLQASFRRATGSVR